MNTKKENQQYSKLKQTRYTGHRLVQSHQKNSQKDMREHNSRILADEFKQIFSFNYPETNVYKTH